MNPILFCDLDGVLNDRTYNAAAESTTILPRCVKQLNRVLGETGCDIVLSSAWRYLVHAGVMKLAGFECMLRSHGVECRHKIVGLTRRDKHIGDLTERGRQVFEYVKKHKVGVYAIVDDLDLGFGGMPFVQTDGKVGMTASDADKLIELLGRKK